MAKRRKRGALDPDYRRKGWNKSAFAPKKSKMTMTEFAFATPFMLWALLAYLPQTRPFMLGPTTWYYGCGAAALLGMVFFVITFKLTWRSVNKGHDSAADEGDKNSGDVVD